MAINSEISALTQVLADESPAGFWRRRQAAKRLAKLATSTDGRATSLTPAEARVVIEGLVAGLESIHWGIHLICRRALERLKDQQLIEAVCALIIERDLPRLRTLAVHRRYEPQDLVHQAAYLFTSGQLQRYEAHDPAGELLESFYVGASQMVREHILSLARRWGDRRWQQLITRILRNRVSHRPQEGHPGSGRRNVQVGEYQTIKRSAKKTRHTVMCSPCWPFPLIPSPLLPLVQESRPGELL